MSHERLTQPKPDRHPPEIETFLEWQDHQFDPGHWTGGRIPPLYNAKRPNPFGWVLIIAGATFWALVLMEYAVPADGPRNLLQGWVDAPGTLFGAVLSTLAVVSGIRLVRGPRRGRRATPSRS